MENGLSTGEKEAAELTGTDYSLNLQTRSREVELLKKYGLIKEVVQANEVAIEPDEGGEK
jgi:hypothetical protein